MVSIAKTVEPGVSKTVVSGVSKTVVSISKTVVSSVSGVKSIAVSMSGRSEAGVVVSGVGLSFTLLPGLLNTGLGLGDLGLGSDKGKSVSTIKSSVSKTVVSGESVSRVDR